MKIAHVFFASILLLSNLATGAPLDDYANQYFEKLRTSGTSVFYSECLRSSGKATLVFGLGEKTALLIESKNGGVVNLATILIDRSDFKIEDTHGGAYSYGRVRNLIKELLGYPFKFTLPAKLADIMKVKPVRSCVDKPPS